MNDQAERLRSLVAKSRQEETPVRSTRVITITSGKGGVGKSNFTLNYALGLAKQGKQVVILDADVGFGNIDVLMGVTPKKTLADLIRKEATLQDILETGPCDIKFIAGGSGFQDLLDIQQEEFDYLLEQLGELQGFADYVLIDTGAGLNAQTLQLILSSDDVYVVLTPEPTAITDAYALIKMVVNREPATRIQLVVNRAQSMPEGKETAEKIRLVAQRFLNVGISTLCVLLDDPNVSKSVKRQVPFLLAYPNGLASMCITNVVQAQIKGEVAGDVSTRGMKQFLHRMVRLFQ
ncbi:cobyrinic acid a,c-diamide synthase [Tumebacillus algifaecis]|uniref:Cobyrinic acid a,c-diamide synthase n=1 Tax=Tumebacillus algifaecis TaxID=1214604 RepID=A0A223D203_9BACL|nr:MinD/ParA family protein [Tumebacillus algifaecis]ASS75632.1 cobyrinic acid a,c-diamide synthase [Tumebacillus algifaecis]